MTGVDDRAVSRRDMVAREAVRLPGDPSLREIVAAYADQGKPNPGANDHAH